jgi:hypothetical protein
MSLLSKFYYHTWNIGFIERGIEDVVAGEETAFPVHWVKHNYKDRFFADPFLLSADDKCLKVLVEDFPYYHKKGMISLLTVDRKTYQLLDRKVVLKQPFHMSYLFIFRNADGSVKWVAPEASQSGKLFRYKMNPQSGMLENQATLFPEPLLDSTILEHNGKYWLFCTKRGSRSNRDLLVYFSDCPEGPWMSHAKNPVVQDFTKARPAGNMVKIGGLIYRLSQKCDKCYGEDVNVSLVTTLTETDFEEEPVKQVKACKDDYSFGFHTLNGLDGIAISVVDGLRKDFRPVRRIVYEMLNFISKIREGNGK